MIKLQNSIWVLLVILAGNNLVAEKNTVKMTTTFFFACARGETFV